MAGAHDSSDADLRKDRRPHVLLGLSGSVAAVKHAELAVKLSKWCEVRIIMTKAASHFVDITKGYAPEHAAALEALLLPTYTDEDEWSSYSSVKKDPVLHIELRKWADLLLVAPCSANTLAKLAGGLADNLLTCVARAWPCAPDGTASKPLLLAPAMNTHMWNHPFTGAHIKAMQAIGALVIPPKGSSTLACGDTGAGALAAVEDILGAVRGVFGSGVTSDPGGGSPSLPSAGLSSAGAGEALASVSGGAARPSSSTVGGT